jgi:hypothetical protein
MKYLYETKRVCVLGQERRACVCVCMFVCVCHMRLSLMLVLSIHRYTHAYSFEGIVRTDVSLIHV